MALQFLYTFMILIITSCLLQGSKMTKGKEILAHVAGWSLMGIIVSAICAVWGL